MRFEETVQFKQLNSNAETHKSIDDVNVLTLADPVTQLCKRIKAFFNKDKEIHCAYLVNNNHGLGPKVDPETGDYIYITVPELPDPVIEDEEHICEFRIFTENYEKAQCLANVIRHKHLVREIYEDSQNEFHYRAHYLQVRIFYLSAIDPIGAEGGTDP